MSFIPQKKTRRSETSTFSEAFEQWLKKNELEDRYAISTVTAHWAELVGPVIARHTKYVKVENKVLYVAVDNAPLRQQLGYSKSNLIRLVNEQAGRQIAVACFIL